MKRLIAAALLLASVPAMAGTPEGKAAWAAGDFNRAVAQYRPAAEAGDAEAQMAMGEAYRLGRGVPPDQDAALGWYRRSAAQGNAPARDALGLMLFALGRRAEAMPLLEAAAQGGDPRALYLLGTAHFNGDNTTRDWPLAYAMMSRSAATGLAQARTSLEVMDRYLFPADKVKAQALLAGMPRGPTSPAPQKTPTVAAKPPPRPAPAIAAPPKPPADPPAAMAMPKPAPAKPAQTAAATGMWRVQLGAFGSADRAEAAWKKLTGKVATLRALDRRIVAAGSIQRLQAGGIAGRAAAGDICKSVIAAGGDCITLAP